MKQRPRQRGLTVVELMLALVITAMVGAAIVSMLGMISIGVDTRRDQRSVMIRCNLAQTRLADVVAPSRCVLDTAPDRLVLWARDTRRTGTVYASGVVWLFHESDEERIRLAWIEFPDSWTALDVMAADQEYRANANWMDVYDDYVDQGLMAHRVLLNEVPSMQIVTDQPGDPLAARLVVCRLSLADHSGDVAAVISSTIQRHRPPKY